MTWEYVAGVAIGLIFGYLLGFRHGDKARRDAMQLMDVALRVMKEYAPKDPLDAEAERLFREEDQ